MTAALQTATVDDLYRVEGKAELVGGSIVRYAPRGHRTARISLHIAISLDRHARLSGRGHAYASGIGFAIRPPLTNGRESFSPDASYYDGPLPQNEMRFVEGAPTFAVEVRSEGDYGTAAEAEMTAKRAGYFEAGTKVVWDVDPQADTIARYSADSPHQPAIFRRGQMADAEPAVPGWRVAVDELFDGP